MDYKKVLIFSMICSPAHLLACDDNGLRQQYVYASSGTQQLESWAVSAGKIKTLVMPNDYSVGIKIENATPDYYTEQFETGKHVPEMVKITIYDMSSKSPRELTYTWGGANSIQGYSEKGGADRVLELGSDGITLQLMKPVCVKTGA